MSGVKSVRKKVKTKISKDLKAKKDNKIKGFMKKLFNRK